MVSSAAAAIKLLGLYDTFGFEVEDESVSEFLADLGDELLRRVREFDAE